jgi:hypothetical protein
MGRILAILLLLLIAVAAGAYIVYHRADLVVKVALEQMGPSFLGASVDAQAVDVVPQEGRAVFRGLEVGNVPGYSTKYAFRADEVRVIVDPLTVTNDVVVIREIVIEVPRISYERGPTAINLQPILQKIEARFKRKVVVERLEIRGGRILVTVTGAKGQGVTIELPTVLLRDLGRNKGGLTIRELAQLVAAALEAKLPQKLLTELLADQKR